MARRLRVKIRPLNKTDWLRNGIEKQGGSGLTVCSGVGAAIMNLTDDQKQKVSAWILDGLKLSEIQNRLQTDLGVVCTYMEVRFLVDDLRLMPKDPPPPPAPPVAPAAAAAPKSPGPTAPGTPDVAEEPELVPGPEPGPGLGKVSMTVDKLAVPGTIVSGSVTFSDGKTAQWYLDEMGRLGLAPREKGYRPPPQDVQSFQLQLQRELQKLGF